MTRLTEIVPRLKSLLLLLSSDRDGDVVAAARAVGRTLKSAGGDWHDLTDLLTAASAPRHDDKNDWRAMREFCALHGDLLTLREWDFVNSLQRWRGTITAKQRNWLEAIYARIRRAA
jgi:hypothetical protein